MENRVWSEIYSGVLVSGCDWKDAASSIRAKIFGKMLELAQDRVSYYLCDLYGDAIWLEKTMIAPMGFDWMARESGTFIGETARLLKEEDYPNATKYRFVVRLEESTRWILDIHESTPVPTLPAPVTPSKGYWGTEEAAPFVGSELSKEEEVDLGAKYRDELINDIVLSHKDEDVLMELLFGTKVDNPTLRNNTTTRKENTLEDYIQELRDKMSTARDELDTAHDKLTELQDFVYGLEGYHDELDSFISSIEGVPEFDESFEYDVRFDSSN